MDSVQSILSSRVIILGSCVRRITNIWSAIYLSQNEFSWLNLLLYSLQQTFHSTNFYYSLLQPNTLLSSRTVEASEAHSFPSRADNLGTSVVAQNQWLRPRLPLQGTWVWALGREDPICCGATKPVRHNYWACTLEPMSHSYWAHVPQLLKPAHLKPMLRNKRSHHNEKPAHCNEE